MKALKIIIVVFSVLIVGYLVLNLTADPVYKIEESITIDRPIGEVYQYASDLRNWPSWGVWNRMDTTMTYEFSENTAEREGWYSWKSESMGNGKMTIMETTPMEHTDYLLEFDGMGSSNTSFHFTALNGNSTQITWTMSGEFPWFMAFMAGSMEKATSKDFQAGLKNLKENIENSKPAITIEDVTMNGGNYYYVTREMKISAMDESSQVFQEGFGQVGAFIGTHALTGAPFGMWIEWDEANDRQVFQLGMPCADDLPLKEGIQKGMIHTGRALKAVHIGGFNTEAEHMAIDEYIKKNGFISVGGPYEFYPVNPEIEKDTTKWIVEIYYPIQ